jgi:hypothetical protein
MTYRLEDNELTKEQALWFVEATGLLCAAATADWGSTKEVKALRAFINKQTVNATFGKGAWGATQLHVTRGWALYSGTTSDVVKSLYHLRNCVEAPGQWALDPDNDNFRDAPYLWAAYEKYGIDEEEYIL